jgi:phage-related protein
MNKPKIKPVVTLKQLFFVGSSRDDLRSFPEKVRLEIGNELTRVQAGLMPTNWKPMKSVGAGVYEVRVKDSSGAFRVFYVANKSTGVYVLHAFQKKTPKTAQHDINLGKERFSKIK